MIDPVVSMKYMLGGYIAISAVLIAYLVSLVLRWRNLKRDKSSGIDLTLPPHRLTFGISAWSFKTTRFFRTSMSTTMSLSD